MKEFVEIKINTKSKIPYYKGITYYWSDGRKPRTKKTLNLKDEKFWWIVGRYIGDGWIRTQGGIIICCAKNELNEITSVLDNYFHYNIVEEKTVYKIHIPDKELSTYLEQFGKGAKNKHLSNEVLDLPTEQLTSFLNGYLSADGCYYKNCVQCNSVSKQLIYDLWQVMIKVYKKPVFIYKVVPAPKKNICGRIVNQSVWYQLRMKFVESRKAFYKDGSIYYNKNTSFIKSNLINDLNVHESIINEYIEKELL